MTERPDFTVVIATRNRCDRLTRVLGDLGTMTADGRMEVVVVDDGSTDDTAARVRAIAERWPAVVYRRTESARGPAHARNIGWRTGTGRYVAFTDDDCRVQPGWPEALLRGHESGADIVQGPTVPDPDVYERRTALSHWIDVEHASYRYETCNVSYRRELLEQLSGFDESFGTTRGGAPYGEDADLGWRAREAGAGFTFVEDAVVVHDVVDEGFWRFLTRRLRRSSMPYFVAMHPGYRRLLPHPWLLTRAHPPAVLALLGWVVGAAVAVTSGSLVVLVAGPVASAPYVHYRLFRERVSGRRRMWPVAIAATWVADLVEIGALAVGSVRARTLLL